MKNHPSPFLARAAYAWYFAEHEARSFESAPTNADIYAIAIPRVQAVWQGEVKWSEASKGDKAVWRGRARDPERARDARYANYYDTFLLPVPYGERYTSGSWRIFGNRNIGNVSLCNLQIPGQMGGDTFFRVDRIYAEPTRDLVGDEKITVSWTIGCRHQWTLPLNELRAGVQAGDVIPPRQNFDVLINYLNWEGSELGIRVHLEGIEAEGGACATRETIAAACASDPARTS